MGGGWWIWGGGSGGGNVDALHVTIDQRGGGRKNLEGGQKFF